jgi:hypothetical protein
MSTSWVIIFLAPLRSLRLIGMHPPCFVSSPWGRGGRYGGGGGYGGAGDLDFPLRRLIAMINPIE